MTAPLRACVRFLLDKAAHFISFDLKPLHQHVALTGDGLDMQMIRQCLIALDELASTVVAVMVLFAVMNVPIFLILS